MVESAGLMCKMKVMNENKYADIITYKTFYKTVHKQQLNLFE